MNNNNNNNNRQKKKKKKKKKKVNKHTRTLGRRKVSSSTVEDGEVRGRLRKARADAGSVRLSERDGPLRLIGEQYAISVAQRCV